MVWNRGDIKANKILFCTYTLVYSSIVLSKKIQELHLVKYGFLQSTKAILEFNFVYTNPFCDIY